MDNFFQGDAFTWVIKKFRKDRLLVAKRAACRIYFVHQDQVLPWLIALMNFRCLPRNVIFKTSCVILAFSFFFKRHDITIESPARLIYKEQNFVSKENLHRFNI